MVLAATRKHDDRRNPGSIPGSPTVFAFFLSRICPSLHHFLGDSSNYIWDWMHVWSITERETIVILHRRLGGMLTELILTYLDMVLLERVERDSSLKLSANRGM